MVERVADLSATDNSMTTLQNVQNDAGSIRTEL